MFSADSELKSCLLILAGTAKGGIVGLCRDRVGTKKTARSALLRPGGVEFFPVVASELDGAEAAVYEDAVLGLEVELDVAFGDELDDEKLAGTFEQELVALVGKGRIERLSAVGVQTVARQVGHVLHVDEIQSGVLVVLCVVGQGKREGIDIGEVLAADGDAHGVAGLVAGLVGLEREAAGHLAAATFVDAAVEERRDVRDVVSVDEAVLVDVAHADVAVEVGVAGAQTGVVHVRGEVAAVNLAVAVDVAGDVA